MNATQGPIPFAGSQLSQPRHVCAFFNSDDEKYRVLLPFQGRVRVWREHACGQPESTLRSPQTVVCGRNRSGGRTAERSSKYPPAEPEALTGEPLKAAVGSLTRPH
jgi:hypothetical protein